MILDFVRLEEGVEFVALILMLAFAGAQFTNPQSIEGMRAKQLAGATFLLYAGAGMCSWPVTAAVDLIVIILRASLAAGIVYGFAMIVLTPASIVLKHLKPKPASRAERARPQPQTIPSRVRSPEEIARERQEAERAAQDAIREEDKAERERGAKVDDAKAEVNQFYNQHESLIRDVLPAVLLRSELHNRFPEGITPENAWKANREMIIEMLSHVEKGHERERKMQEAERDRARRTRQLSREIRNLEEQIERLTASPLSDPEVLNREITALQERIRDLKEERQDLQMPDKESSP